MTEDAARDIIRSFLSAYASTLPALVVTSAGASGAGDRHRKQPLRSSDEMMSAYFIWRGEGKDRGNAYSILLCPLPVARESLL